MKGCVFAPPTCRRSLAQKCKDAASSALLRAGDSLEAMSMRLRGASETSDPISLDGGLLEAWTMSHPPAPSVHRHLCLHTFKLASGGRITLSQHILLLEAWSVAAQRFPATFTLPRPLLRAVAAAIWQKGGAASIRELNLAAVCTRPFFTVMHGSSADLARSILDGVILHAAAHIQQVDSGLAAANLAPCLGMAAYASRRASTQRQLHQLRQAADDARPPLEAAILERMAWMKGMCGCNSVTAQGQMAAALARESQHHTSVREVFIKAFGCAPEGHDEQEALATAEEALVAWRAGTQPQQAAGGKGAEGESILPTFALRSDWHAAAAEAGP
ncbi:hypothetical protein D9Q98_002034 [Chlorella vulgaris]|uniref:Uncharacterized protein n=1 Tax=Chlorella vulgaris TaxID=3077 RepID=A0A9D4Z0C5_CHLVU|nr:hypothetical protein D9Q98_002034 [Chlorella vulgaris]